MHGPWPTVNLDQCIYNLITDQPNHALIMADMIGLLDAYHTDQTNKINIKSVYGNVPNRDPKDTMLFVG